MTEGYWRRKVRERDGDVCRMEINLGGGWRQCGAEAHHTAHIYRRHACGLAKFEPDVAIRACYDCHREFDSRGGAVRVPAYAEERAYKTIVAFAKNAPPPPRQDLFGRRL